MQEVEEFFGCRHPTLAEYPQRDLKLDTWSQDDSKWGEALLLHYQECTRPLIGSIDNVPTSCDNLQLDTKSSRSRIPRLIHFIWLGSDPFPPHSLGRTEHTRDVSDDRRWNDTMQSWADYHSESSNWRIQVWTDDSVAELRQLHPPLVNDAAFAYALSIKNYGLASDILRLELLYKFGGVYIDVDYVCFGSVSEFHHHFEFYCGGSNTGCVELNNGLLGSKPNHPLVLKMMNEISLWFEKGDFRVREKKQEPATKAESMSFLESFLDDASASALRMAGGLQQQPTDSEIITHTGPGLLTRTICKIVLKKASTCMLVDERETSGSFDHGRVAVFPSEFFHPFPNNLRDTPQRSTDFSLGLKRFVVPAKTKALHLWGCSWQK
uniref:Alpha 1,4-glycosyltransferase domain-containing protein n=1 Tax=Pseudictyota dubia TaxID=2749911 RepID=A0A7R9VF39_9STRA|mmetsp:Transcript_12959/g.24182  ORF Transcript_12959/g.24182 Transcript_12959/m.24182 type:complete len:380 (+) Transcript_12959:810-1949(+)